MRAAARIALLVTLIASVVATGAAGETVSDTADRRILGGHAFVPSANLREPFIVTSLTNVLGIGTASNLQNTVLEIDGEPVVQLEGKLTFIALDITFQQAVREWLAASIRFGGLGRLGTNTTSLLAQGVTAAAGWRMEWLMRLTRHERWMLSASVGLENTSGTIVNILDWAESGTDLVRKTHALSGQFGLRGAYAFSPTVGAVGSVQAGYGESFDPRAEDQWFADVEAGLSVDLGPPWNWPLGVVLGARYNSLPDGAEDIGRAQAAIVLRFAYTGREDFVVGLDLTGQSFPQYGSEELVRAGTTGLGMHYYF